MLDAAGHVAFSRQEAPQEEVGLGLRVADGQGLAKQLERLVDVAELVDKGAEVGEDEVSVGDGDLSEGETVAGEASPGVAEDPPVGGRQEVQKPGGPGARILDRLDPRPKLRDVLSHVHLPEGDEEPRPRVLVRDLVLGDGCPEARETGVLGGELDLVELILVTGWWVPGQGVRAGGGQPQLSVHHPPQVKPLKYRRSGVASMLKMHKSFLM